MLDAVEAREQDHSFSDSNNESSIPKEYEELV